MQANNTYLLTACAKQRERYSSPCSEGVLLARRAAKYVTNRVTRNKTVLEKSFKFKSVLTLRAARMCVRHESLQTGFSYHSHRSILLAGQTSHFSSKLDVKMSNYFACSDQGPLRHIAFQNSGEKLFL